MQGVKDLYCAFLVGPFSRVVFRCKAHILGRTMDSVEHIPMRAPRMVSGLETMPYEHWLEELQRWGGFLTSGNIYQGPDYCLWVFEGLYWLALLN